MDAENLSGHIRLQRYQDIRPMGLYRWDLEYLLDVLPVALEDRNHYPSQHSQAYLALKSVHDRLKQGYASSYR